MSSRVFRRMRPSRERLRSLRDRLLLPEASSGHEQWQRIPLDRAVAARIETLHPPDLTAVEISGAGRAAHPWKAFTSLDYPDFDLRAPLRGEGPFDVVICEQVLEHVDDLWAAVANLRDLCAPGGHVIVSTPFLIRVHELPSFGMRDYWRFTPRGLQTLLERAGLTVEQVGSWGNRDCVRGNFDGWPAFRRWHSLRNESDLPVQVWAFARRPLCPEARVAPGP